MKITVVFGLPGAGKTTYIKSTFKNELIFDDISVLAGNKHIEVFLSEVKNQINNKDIVISDPMLCLKKNQSLLMQSIDKIFPQSYVEWVFIDTPSDIARKRAVHSSEGTHSLLRNNINLDIDNLKSIKGWDDGDKNRKRTNKQI